MPGPWTRATARELWHYFWKTKGGTHIGNRGLGMWHNYLFMETPDDYLVSLDAQTGKERWHKPIADLAQGYFSTPAPDCGRQPCAGGHGQRHRCARIPAVVRSGNRGSAVEVLHRAHEEGRSGAGYVGQPGRGPARRRAGLGSRRLRSGNAISTFSALAIRRLLLPPARAAKATTCSPARLVALNVDTGKMAWYYSTSPHDMHDYDSAQTPVLVDAMFNGKMRKLVLTAARNGYYFTLDRVTGEHLVTSKYGLFTNWAKGLNQRALRSTIRKRTPRCRVRWYRRLRTAPRTGSRPLTLRDTGLFYVAQHNGYSLFYLTDVDPRGSMGLGGKEEAQVGSGGSFLTAIDYKTGKIAWRRPYYGEGGGGGLLTTAGKLLFAGDGAGNLVAYDAATGKPLWNTRIGDVTNAPQTFMLDGHQYLIAATGDTLWSFVLY